MSISDEALKREVRSYWNANICDTKEHLVSGKLKDAIPYPVHSREYFAEISRRRVASFDFARPEKYKGKRVLEVGVGSGVDFVRWPAAGANAFGVDLTENGIKHCRKWLDCYELNATLSVCDAENLQFEDDTFDLVYSWGVLHHTPNTLKAISECVRVTKVGGEIKLMLYNKWSFLWAAAVIIKVLTGKDIESKGTQAFSKSWAKSLQDKLPVKVKSVEAKTCSVDLLLRYGETVSSIMKFANRLVGNNSGFFMTIRMERTK